MKPLHKLLFALPAYWALGLASTYAQTIVPATDMMRSQEAFPRGDHVMIFGKETVKTYLYYAVGRLPSPKFKLQIEAAGESAEGRWPRLGVALDDTGKIMKELEVNSADFRTYDFGAIDAAAAATIYFVYTNDYYNPVTRADVNLKIRQATFTASTPPPPPARLDTFVVKGSSAVLEWNPNREQDLQGYRVFKGLESGKNLSPMEAGKMTNYKLDLSPNYKYYFAVAAYDTAGNQSPLSKEVLVLVEAESGSPSGSDLNGDGKCDAADRAIVEKAFGSTCNGRRYDRLADLNQDCKVDGLDLILFNANCQ